MGLQEYVISGLLFGLFIFSMISFYFIMASDNNNTAILNDPSLNKAFNSVNETLGGVQQKVETQYNATSTEPISIGFGTLILFSIRGAGTIFGGVVSAILTPIYVLTTEVLGIPPMVLGILTSIVVISLIFLGWKMWRLGT